MLKKITTTIQPSLVKRLRAREAGLVSPGLMAALTTATALLELYLFSAHYDGYVPNEQSHVVIRTLSTHQKTWLKQAIESSSRVQAFVSQGEEVCAEPVVEIKFHSPHKGTGELNLRLQFTNTGIPRHILYGNM